MAEKDLNDLLDDFNDQDTESLMKSILGEDNLPEEEDLKSLKKPKIKKKIVYLQVMLVLYFDHFLQLFVRFGHCWCDE